jgi:DNA-binding NtrC family response regulator
VSLKDLEKLLGSAQTGASVGRPVVVVIDDDVIVRNSIARVLKATYDVRACADGVHGVLETDKHTSCVILDVRMPRHDGFWVCKQLQNKAPDVPIIFHSAYQDAKAPSQIVDEFHPFGYVVKGEKVGELLSIVAKAVEHTERLREGLTFDASNESDNLSSRAGHMRAASRTPVPRRRSTGAPRLSVPAPRSTFPPGRRSTPVPGR